MEELIALIVLVLTGYGCYTIYKSLHSSTRATGQTGTGNTSRTTGDAIRPGAQRAEHGTGTMIYMANGASPGQDNEFHFNYKKCGGGWRAYILRMPPLRGRDSNAHITHRLHDQEGYYVCWDKTIPTLKEMQTTSKMWADSLQQYIQTGRTF